MLAQMQSYTPTEYLPGSQGRYRQYPRTVDTPIPGAGYDVDRMVWAEQELNLSDGKPQNYGDYETVPLRGIGDAGDGLGLVNPALMATFRPPFQFLPNATITAQDAGLLQTPTVTPVGFFHKKVGPVPVWTLGLLGVAALGGGAVWALRRKKKVRTNRRRRTTRGWTR